MELIHTLRRLYVYSRREKRGIITTLSDAIQLGIDTLRQFDKLDQQHEEQFVLWPEDYK